MSKKYAEDDICCPKFDPAPWDEKVLKWQGKKFIKDSVFTFFFMPLNFGQVMKRLDQKVRRANAEIPDWMGLSDHTSKWNMDIYLAVDREIPGENNVTMNGTYVSKVFEGPYNETGNWYKQFNSWCDSQGHKTVKNFMWYTTCPKCAKKYGKNYVVLISETEN